MFVSVFAPAHCLRVSRAAAPPAPGDFAALIRTTRQFGEEAHHTALYPVHVLIQEEIAAPNATERRQMAEVVRSIQAPRLVFAMVTASMLHRGALKAITWLAPPPLGHHVDAFASIIEARRWIELTIHEPLPMLLELAAQVGHRPWS